jgi:hypothetical protein
MGGKVYTKLSKIAIADFKSCVLQCLSIDSFHISCSGSFPDKKKVEEDNLDRSFEASDHINQVRLVTPYPSRIYPLHHMFDCISFCILRT